MARVPKLLLAHESRRCDEPRVVVVAVDREHLLGAFEGGVEVPAGDLQLRQGQAREDVVGAQIDGLLETLARLLPLAARGVGAAQVVLRDGVIRRVRHDGLQLRQRLGNVAFVQHEGGRQAARVVVVGIVLQDLRIQIGRLGPLALPHEHFDDALLVGGLPLDVLRHALAILADGGVAVSHAQIEIAHGEVCLLEFLGMGFDLIEDAHHVVTPLLHVVMHGQQGQVSELFRIVLAPSFKTCSASAGFPWNMSRR